MKVRVVIAKQVGTEDYTAILHWPGGVRFENVGTLTGCYRWLDDEMAKLLDEFEVVYDRNLDIAPKKVVEP